VNDLTLRRPTAALRELRRLVVPDDAPDDSRLELVIRTSDRDLSIRDLSAFLDLIDSLYGRLSPKGFRSYARRERGHIEIWRLEPGSWELVLETLLSRFQYPEILLVIWMALKYLPRAVQSVATAYNQIEQGRLARQSRKRIRAEMDADEKLRSISPERRRELARLIDILYEREAVKLPRAVRFARAKLIDVVIRVRRGNQ